MEIFPLKEQKKYEKRFGRIPHTREVKIISSNNVIRAPILPISLLQTAVPLFTHFVRNSQKPPSTSRAAV